MTPKEKLFELISKGQFDPDNHTGFRQCRTKDINSAYAIGTEVRSRNEIDLLRYKIVALKESDCEAQDSNGMEGWNNAIDNILGIIDEE